MNQDTIKKDCLQIIIHDNTKYELKIKGRSKINYYPRKMLLDMLTKCTLQTPAFLNDKKLPIIIYDNVSNKTTVLNNENKEFSDAHIKFNNVPKSVRYRPNELITVEKENWQLDSIKRQFNYYKDDIITKQEYVSRMLIILQ
tara:strand:- start:338 stop:763 length:426 start_codon:yes stop_codon:yes gene_type:complete